VTILQPVTEPVSAAKAAGLRYVSDTQPGIRRVPSGKGFRYLDADGKPVRDPGALQRIRSLVIPPAWTDVWICPSPLGHVQATGRDARGRKQYRYHPRWQQMRDETKYHRMVAFGLALPRIRRRVEQDLQQHGLSREKILATVVRLLETTFIRVGNEEYARENHSFGLTTLRNRHVEVNGYTIQFHFRGKRGIKHHVGVNDRRLARIIRGCQELPGEELFEYIDDAGTVHGIGSEDVNEYLREITQDDFTAKDFRTWAGTVLIAQQLLTLTEYTSKTQAKRNVVQAIDAVAQRLGNTRAVCRKCYIHPAVIETYLNGGSLPKCAPSLRQARRACIHGLSVQERALLAYLRKASPSAAKASPFARAKS
jgi:DNA topoisomerase I